MTQEIDVPKAVKVQLGAGENVLFREKGRRFVKGGEEWHPSEIFVTNIRLIFFKHGFFGRGETEDLHYRDIVSVNVKIGILSCHPRIKSRFGGNDRDIEIHAVHKDRVYKIEAIINNGIARDVDGRGRFSEP